MIRSPFQLLTCLILICCASARGDTYVSNLAEDGTYPRYYGFNFDSGTAAAFITGSNPGGYTLDSATVTGGVFSFQPSAFAMQIWSNVGGRPTTLLEELSGTNSSPNEISDITYNSTGLFLAPNTEYWLATQRDYYGYFEWMEADSASYSSSGGWSRDADRQVYLFYPHDQTFSNGDWVTDNPGINLKFAIDATPIEAQAAVPEPGTYVAAGLAAVTAIWRRRKR